MIHKCDIFIQTLMKEFKGTCEENNEVKCNFRHWLMLQASALCMQFHEGDSSQYSVRGLYCV